MILSVKSISLIIKFAYYAFMGVIIYLIFLTYLMISNINYQLDHATVPLLENVTWWSNHYDMIFAS
jgi:hypothetical protein